MTDPTMFEHPMRCPQCGSSLGVNFFQQKQTEHLVQQPPAMSITLSCTQSTLK